MHKVLHSNYRSIGSQADKYSIISKAQRTKTTSSFAMRTLQSAVATEVAKSMFERYGYEVRHTGYEYTMPEWRHALKSADPNLAAARVRVMPDLTVYDRSLNTLYEVEVKTTMQKPSCWKYRKDQLDTFRYHHPNAILMVYAQRPGEFYVQRTRSINWTGLRLKTDPDAKEQFYIIDLKSQFVLPPEMFEQIHADTYPIVVRDLVEVLEGFTLAKYR